ncbi:MAG TPA: PilX N-terminal domain-containing pilus assembly protein, partial [Anaerolineales bacterium]|nr:PilX N-terminal domain-containing pilus assembly protein [Anaerolineales bacterium]
MKIKKGRGQEGIALVITLLVMTLLLIMGSAFMSISSTETLIAINERNRVQAYHLAEAGAEMAIARLNGDIAYVGSGGDQALGAGTYNVAVTCVPPAAPAPPCP